MSRKDHTLCFQAVDANDRPLPAKYIPIEDVECLYAFGSLDMNSSLLNYLGQQGIHIHFFDYYEHYTGSFAPREYLLAGKMQIEQTRTHLNSDRRMYLATQLLDGASWNMLHNLKYYHRRERDLSVPLTQIEEYRRSMPDSLDIPALMGIEGNIRQAYYGAFDSIVQGSDFEMGGRSKQPPRNEINALISFGNMLSYTLALQAIYHTQLNPTISFLHEPHYRRYSLALDIAEVFKPILVDRIIFKMLNKKEVNERDFDRQVAGCYLKESGKKSFLRNWDERLNETIQHPNLHKKVSYKYLVRLECYKIAKYILGIESGYKPYKMY